MTYFCPTLAPLVQQAQASSVTSLHAIATLPNAHFARRAGRQIDAVLAKCGED